MKKRCKGILVCALAVLALGCSTPSSSSTKYTITFNSQGGSAVSDQLVESGAKATAPTAPTKSGYTFYGWYKEAGGQNAWNFASDTVAANITLYAKWVTVWTGLIKSVTYASYGVSLPLKTVTDPNGTITLSWYEAGKPLSYTGTSTASGTAYTFSITDKFETPSSAVLERGTLSFTGSMNESAGTVSGNYSLDYENAGVTDETGTIKGAIAGTGIAGTWSGQWQDENAAANNGWITVAFNSDGTFTAAESGSASGISFGGTWTLTGTSLTASSSGNLSSTYTSHTGSYSAALDGNILTGGRFSINAAGGTSKTYTGSWSLGKDL